MAETPRDKRDKQLINARIEAYKAEQINSFRDLTIQAEYYNSMLKSLGEELKNTSKDASNYSELKSQVEETSKLLNGIRAQKSEVAETLESLGRQDVIETEKVLQASIKMQQKVDKAKAKVEAIDYEIDELNAKENKSDQEISRLEALRSQRQTAEKQLHSAQEKQELTPYIQEQQQQKQTVKAVVEGIGKSSPFAATAIQGAMNHGSLTGGIARKAGTVAETVASKFGPIGALIGKGIRKLCDIGGSILDATIAVRKILDDWTNQAATVLANNVGRINAALEGTGLTYKNSIEQAVESLGVNRYVKQTEYLSQIANLTTRGITYNVEQRALLETIKDKTIASFSSMEGNLLRLVRLKQQDLTANQFGLEVALRNTLNRVFKDSTYLEQMFSGIQGAITDAVMISGSKDITEYSSTVQTWMGAMYESGIDSSTVNKFASAINYLGSGNVSALASDADMQRLILLSMDTIGMDYADVLQQGLSASDITDLLTAVVTYLTKIESNTKDNNVLTSSYTQLFGMSMADLQGFKNLKDNIGQLTVVNQSSAMDVVRNELELYQSTQRNTAAEQVENVISNAQYAMGANIAGDTAKYLSWKTSNLILDVYDTVQAAAAASKTKVPGILKDAAIGAEAVIEANTFNSVWQVVKGLPALFEMGGGNLQSFVSSTPSSYGNAASLSASIGKGATAEVVGGKEGGFKTTYDAIQSNIAIKAIGGETADIKWGQPEKEEDETLGILREFSNALVQADANNAHKAFATYLVGLTNEALSSFASIFADESAMGDTFSGNNKVLSDNLFKYGEDTTSNSTAASSNTTSAAASAAASGNTASAASTAANAAAAFNKT